MQTRPLIRSIVSSACATLAGFTIASAQSLEPIGQSGSLFMQRGFGEAVSADGSAVAGWGRVTPGNYGSGVLWTDDGDETLLTSLPDAGNFTTAWGISVDGQTVVGSSVGPGGTGDTAVRWTAGASAEALGPFPPSSGLSVAQDASADGSVIVGRVYTYMNPVGPRAFR